MREYEYLGKKIRVKDLEIGKGYKTLVLYFELPNVQHFSYSIKKDNIVVAKGEIARALREKNIHGLEVVSPPPANTNALLQIRITEEEKEVLEKLIPHIYNELKNKNLI